jgi:hypothetical protein
LSSYTVTHVRRELSDDRSHRHIEGVCTTADIHYSRMQVVDSINDGNTWRTSAGDRSALISVVSSCHRPNCQASPYLRTNPDSNTQDNLENLPDC